VRIQLTSAAKREMFTRLNLKLAWDDEVLQFLAFVEFNPKAGARQV
jgi:hypothetical protein